MIMEVALPEVTNVSVQPSPPEIESLHAEIIELKQQLNPLKKVSCHVCSAYCCHATSPTPLLSNHLIKFVGTTELLVIMPTKVKLHALIREIPRLATDGNQCHWPTT